MMLRATHDNKDGLKSSIVWNYGHVTIPRHLRDIIITEYGVADVYLKTLKDRIRTIIKVAHPDFRQELKDKINTSPLIGEDDWGGVDLFDNVEK